MVNRLPRLAIVSTHPIQYNAPLFQLLAQRRKIEIKVFYTWEQSQDVIYDPGFGHHRQWDLPLLDGYDHCFVRNTAKSPGSHHFFGINNPRLIHAIEAWGANALLVFGWAFKSHLSLLRHFKGRLPVFFRGDSTLVDEQPGVKSLARRLFLRWVYRHVDKSFYVGLHNKAYFRKHGLTEAQLVYAPHAVDNDRFGSINKVQENELDRCRAGLGISQKDFVVLFVGKLEAKKNPLFVMNLAQKLNREDIKFLIVGNGELEEGLKAKNKNGVMFLPFQNQTRMPLVYRLGNVLLLPSKGPGETWGLAANEAMACGLPVILSDKTGGAPDLVGDKNTGIVFSGNAVDSVAGYICSLQKDRSFYREIAENARQHIRAFSFENIAGAIEKEMQKI